MYFNTKERRVICVPYDLSNKLKIAVTTRALFQLESENKIYEERGRAEYEEYQISKEDELLQKGAAFTLINALLSINEIPETQDRVEVIIVSRNSANTSLRVYNSIENYNLPITRGFFTGGANLTPYLSALDVDLFLTANPSDAQQAIDAGIPAAVLLTENIPEYSEDRGNQIRIAFDGDAVLFSEESELIYKQNGLDKFAENEAVHANDPMNEGPFAKFLRIIADLQNALGEGQDIIRTALITARNAPSHERVIKTLRAWNVRIDEIFFLGGISKTPILQTFGAQIFFDDQKTYTEPASLVVPSGTVPYSSESKLNEYKK